jgi:hypothetical protein
MGRLLAIAAIVAACAGAVVLSQRTTGPPTEASVQRDAISACEDAVPMHLKSGRADHFAGTYASRFSTGFEVGGTVYATNSFGAVVPQDFTCQVAHNDRESTFTVTSVTFP